MTPDRTRLPLSEAVRRRQQRETLDDERMERLLTLQGESGLDTTAKHPVRSRHWLMGSVALASVLLGFLLGWWNSSLLLPQADNLALARMADEVVANHLKRESVQVSGEKLETLSAWFTDLDFRLIDTPALADAHWLGGLYCSIQGKVAAQLRLRDADGKVRTLYQTRYDADRHGPVPDRVDGEPMAHLMARGIDVWIWREHGVLFVLTGA
ncbi:MAG: hypothetical protein KDH88_16015 [Chromatiales bacterium]|nr:hypothetical protein [Chromatiales bacterium]